MLRCWITDGMIFTFNPGAATALHRYEHRAHLLMYGVDGLQGPDHHPELHDAPCVIAADDVDAVDVFAVDGRLELEHGYVAGEDLLRVVKRAVDRVAGQRLGGRMEVDRRNVLAALRGVDRSASRRPRSPPAKS